MLSRRPRHPPAKLGNTSLGSPSALSAASTPLTIPHKLSRLGPADQQHLPGLHLLPQAYYADSPAAATPEILLPYLDAAPAVDSDPRHMQKTQSVHSFNTGGSQLADAAMAKYGIQRGGVTAKQQSPAERSLFGTPLAPVSSLAKQLQQNGSSPAKEQLSAIMIAPRPSSPNSFQPHALKPMTHAVTRTPSRFGRGMDTESSQSCTVSC